MQGVQLNFKNCKLAVAGGVKVYAEPSDMTLLQFIIKTINITSIIKENGNLIFADSWTDVGFAANYMPKKVFSVLETELAVGLAIVNNVPTLYQVREDKVFVYELGKMSGRYDAIFMALDVVKAEVSK